MANDTATLVEAIVDRLGPAGDVARMAELLYAGAMVDGLAAASAEHLAAETRELFDFLGEKPAGRHKIRVRPSHTGDMTLVEIVNDDMPFLVDSVMGEIQARGLDVRLAVHPIFKTARTADGRLEAILGPADQDWSDGHQESVIVVHLDPVSPETGEDLGRTLSVILNEVRQAVGDWRSILKRVDIAIRDLDDAPSQLPADLKAESLAFLRWLQDGHFTFLGLREYRFEGSARDGALKPVAGSDLGMLRNPKAQVLSRGGEEIALTPEIRQYFLGPSPLIITKANIFSRVHRRAHMDYIGIKTYTRGPRGAAEPTGEIRIVGLFSSRAYTQPAQQIPFLRHKVATVLAHSGFPPASHAGKALINALDTFPRDELFQIGERELGAWSAGILDLELRPRVRVFSRRDRFDRFVSVLVYAPRDRYTTTVRERIAQVLVDTFQGRIAAFYPFFPEGPLVRVQFIVARGEGQTPTVDGTALEARIAGLVRTWDDRLADGLRGEGPGALALTAKYANAFSAAYADSFDTPRAIDDIRRIERLATADQPVAIDFYREPGAPANRVRAAIYRFGEPIRLSERVPVLENLGFSVIDERSYRVTPSLPGGPREVALHDMVLESADGAPIDLATCDQRLEDCFLAVYRQAAENDGFNRLVIASGLDWRQAAVLRAYASYLRQLGTPFGLRLIADALLRHAGIAHDLVELFHVRFDPDHKAGTMAARHAAEVPVRARIEGALASVASLDEDRILRHFLNLVGASVRTNVFQQGANGRAPDTIAFKFASRDVDAAPQPRPFREIWIASPRVEAIHLRFAPIARGGIRWSDRAQDFRTEVLGLVRAQLVKNAVIVPSGAKGGFVPKQLPRTGGRDEVMKEGIAAYRIFVSALLDITDNIVDGRIVPPARLVRHDGDDPYLVVAADKGTATFSDFANEISTAHGHWLGDAFASGGSAGYDHKKMAITAKGAWECVKRHFREIDWDIQTKPFRVVGVGDMSGDVFGNGALLSPVIRLIAAFDHRDIFIDPDPDPATSFAERRRMFELPRSSWQDYDATKISAGGGVFPRSAKAIHLSAEIRAMLGTAAESLTPAELMRALLKSETDLMWFGGIGTYVRASAETDEQAGDRANDGLRITAAELRAKVVGEGANLAMTQKSRIEFALLGGRLNTDFIDNSAGVNSSDQEVNIKIAIGRATQSGELAGAARLTLLASMTGDVAAACLRNNQQQSLALSLAERRGVRDMAANRQLIRALEAHKLVDRVLEALPSDARLAERQAQGQRLSRPELAVLLSYAKIALLDDLLASKVPDEPRLEKWLIDYFPLPLRERFAADIRAHRLRREIIATGLTNAVVNRGGPAFAVRLAAETGRATADAVKAYLAARYVFDTPALSDRIDGLDAQVASATELDLHDQVQDLVQRAAAWFLRDGNALIDLDRTIDLHKTGAAQLAGCLDSVLGGATRAGLDGRRAGLVVAGVPDDLARFMARLRHLGRAPEITSIAAASQRPVAEAARAFFAIGEHFRLGDLAERAAQIPTADDYDRLALAEAENQLATAQSWFARAILRDAATAPDAAAWLAVNAERLKPAKARLDAITADQGLSVSRVTVAAAQLRDLAGA